MFCEGCGNELQTQVVFCPSCGTPADPKITRRPTSQPGTLVVAEQARIASQDTFHALKSFAVNPTGAILPVYDQLERRRAYGVGLVLAILFDCCILFAIDRTLSDVDRIPLLGFASSYYLMNNLMNNVGWIKLFLLCLVPVLCLTLALTVVRLVFQGKGRADGDIFVAGIALLPIGITVALTSVIGVVNVELIGILICFAICYMIMILFVGCLRIIGISEAKSALAVPLILLFGAWLFKVAIGIFWTSGMAGRW